MKCLLIDTNVYTAFKCNDASVVEQLRRADDILVCAAVLGELLGGFKCGSREKQNREELELFLDTPRVSFVSADETTAEFYSEIYRALRGSGRPIPANDMWIAASAMQHSAAVCSLDSHFGHIDGLLFVRPTA